VYPLPWATRISTIIARFMGAELGAGAGVELRGTWISGCTEVQMLVCGGGGGADRRRQGTRDMDPR
jgi:hypothetical protein